ncbi:MAG: TrkA family potassium uptake protein [Anaerolineales bacterium]|nr:TrkA family potassium uptake protein [Anaerolineales bacterium]
MPRRKQSSQEFAVIGLGRFGSSLALTLEEHGHTVLGIDHDPAVVQAIAHQLTQAVVLDATNEEALKLVDIGAFDTAVVAIGADFENNLLTTVALKNLGLQRVITKAMTERQADILRRVGADRVIRPEHDAGRRLAQELSAPSVLERLPLGPAHSVLELVVPEPLAWQSLAQLDLRNRHGITVLVVKRGDNLLVAPPADCIFQQDDILVVLGSNAALQQFAALA